MAAARQWIPEDGEQGATDEYQPWRTSRGETILQSTDAPVYAALADQWRSAGRMVPGQTDTEWAELTGRIPRGV